MSFANVTIEDNGDNVILLIQDNTGHDEGSSALRPRGILNATLLGSNETIQWKLAGTAGAPTNTTLDSVRGPYNEGGLVSERLGWHLPGFDDSRWSDRSPSDGVAEATVQFYRTSLILDVPEQHDVSIVFTISSNATSEVRALLFVNGYQYGRYMPFVGSTSRFPVLPGILNYDGENIIAVSVWSQVSYSKHPFPIFWTHTTIIFIFLPCILKWNKFVHELPREFLLTSYCGIESGWCVSRGGLGGHHDHQVLIGHQV